jgi:AmiR/NasT family two-component response regulator
MLPPRFWPGATGSRCKRRYRIGQAKGIIMERYGVDDVRAFDMLRLISRESQTKLADVAQRVIETRDNK